MASGIDVEMEPWLDTFSGDLRYSLNRFDGDGIITEWELQFAGGYIDQSHVKAYSVNLDTQVKTDLEFTWVNAFTINITPAVPDGERLVVYRDTPKATPLVNFEDGAIFNERNIDKVVTQAIFSAAEMVDTAGEAVDAAVTAAETAGEAITESAASALAAAGSASAAASSANTASAAALAAAASELAADASADAAAISETNAAAAGAAAVASHELADDPHPQYAADGHDHSGVYEPADATILKAAAIGSTVQGFDAETAKKDETNSWSSPQRQPLTADNDLTFDMNVKNKFKCTPTTGGELGFTNLADGQSGVIILTNTANYAITKAAHVKCGATMLATISVTGLYKLHYECDGTNVLVTNSQALS